jgi:hypothetical protein
MSFGVDGGVHAMECRLEEEEEGGGGVVRRRRRCLT